MLFVGTADHVDPETRHQQALARFPLSLAQADEPVSDASWRPA